MKKSTWFYLLMLLFVFILPSFTVPPQGDDKEKERVIHKTSNDSLLILFDSPQITVKDARVEREDGTRDQVIRELVGEFKQFNESVAAYNARSERRWSVVDRIEAETGYKPVDVANFIDQKRKLYRWYAALAIIYMAGVVTIYGKDFRRLKGLTIFPIFVWSVLIGVLYVYIKLLYQTYESYQFWELLKHLSP